MAAKRQKVTAKIKALEEKLLKLRGSEYVSSAASASSQGKMQGSGNDVLPGNFVQESEPGCHVIQYLNNGEHGKAVVYSVDADGWEVNTRDRNASNLCDHVY